MHVWGGSREVTGIFLVTAVEARGLGEITGKNRVTESRLCTYGEARAS
ncbi:hypothetical protein [Paenibacillus marinisediminis]